MAASRKLYVALAEAIKDQRLPIDGSVEARCYGLVINAVAYQVGVVLKKDNPNFDAVRFLEACGVGK